MRALVEALCSDECAGRAPGTPGGRRARGHVVEALRAAGLDPFEQPIPRHGGANVLATLPGKPIAGSSSPRTTITSARAAARSSAAPTTTPPPSRSWSRSPRGSRRAAPTGAAS